MKKRNIIVAVVIAFAVLMMCGCSDLMVDKTGGRTVEIGELNVSIPEGYRTYEEYQQSDQYKDFYSGDTFEYHLEPIYGVKPEYKYFASVDSGDLSTNWFSKEYSEDEVWEGQMQDIEPDEPEQLSQEELDIDGLEDVRLVSYISNNTCFHMEGGKEVYDERDIAVAAFTYDDQVYLFELSESDSQAKATTLEETRQRMVDMLESIGTNLAEQ